MKLLATFSLKMRNSERPFTTDSGNYLAHHSMFRETLGDHSEVFVKLYATISRGRGRTKLNISCELRRFHPASKKYASGPGASSDLNGNSGLDLDAASWPSMVGE